MPKVTLELTPIGDGSKVLVDGHDVSGGVRSLALRCVGGEITTMTLELVLHDMTPVDGEVEILIPDATRDLLVMLGWTPPRDAEDVEALKGAFDELEGGAC